MGTSALDRLFDWLLSQDLISVIVLFLLVRGEIRTGQAVAGLKLLDRITDPTASNPKKPLS